MEKPARTTAVPVPERLDYWRHLVSDAFVPLDATVPRELPQQSDAGFRGQVRGQVLGPLLVNEVTADPHVVRRTRSLIARSDNDYYKVGLQLRGRCLLVQDGWEARLRPGDFAIYDTTRPYTLVFEDSFRMLVVMFPRTMLGIPTNKLRNVTANRMAGDDGVNSVVSGFLQRLPDHLGECSVTGRFRLATHVTELLTSALTEYLEPDAGTAGEPGRLLTAILAYVEQHLGDVELSPDMIAAAHHISTRYLHKLFHAEGNTVAGWIRRRRLERCGHDLRDPMQYDHSISAIARRWGFPDSSHFSHTFKSTFGLSPRDYRAGYAESGATHASARGGPARVG